MRPARSEWVVSRRAVDESRFRAGRLGPYRLSCRTEDTEFGEIVIGVHPRIEEVLEIELLTFVPSDPEADPHSELMTDLAEVAWLNHRALPDLVGSGVHSGIPYVVRRMNLGRSLEELLDERGFIDASAAPMLLWTVADVVGYLAKQGPSAGACSMGGFSTRDVFLGFDGSVLLRGAGLKRLRRSDDPVDDDIHSVIRLARLLDEMTDLGLSAAVEARRSASSMAKCLAKRFPEAITSGQRALSALMRDTFGERVLEDRAFFGLATIH